MLAPQKASYDIDSILKSKDITLQTKVCIVKAMVCPAVMYGYESWTIKKAECCFFNCGTGEDSWGSLNHKEMKLVSSKWNQPWIFIGRTDAEAKAPILWPHDVKSWLTGKDPDAGKDWRQRRQRQEQHRFNGYESEQTLGDSGEQRSLACCSQ